MHIALYLTHRYFQIFRRLSTWAQILGGVCFVSTMCCTLALVLALAAFNGLAELTHTLLEVWTPDLKLTSCATHYFCPSKTLVRELSAIPGVQQVITVQEDNAAIQHKQQQVVVKLKGVSENFVHARPLNNFLVHGTFQLHNAKNAPVALMGRGIQAALQMPWQSRSSCNISLYYPRQQSLVKHSQRWFKQQKLQIAGIIAVEKQFDEQYVIAPLSYVQQLTGQAGYTAIEIQLSASAKSCAVKKSILKILPEQYRLQDALEQNTGLKQAEKTEKLFMLALFWLIMLIASFNLFFFLVMLLIDRQHDVALLTVIGATTQQIRAIFAAGTCFLVVAATICGAGLAVGLVVGQYKFHWVSLGSHTTIVQHYPVALHMQDLGLAVGSILLLSICAMAWPLYRVVPEHLIQGLRTKMV